MKTIKSLSNLNVYIAGNEGRIVETPTNSIIFKNLKFDVEIDLPIKATPKGISGVLDQKVKSGGYVFDNCIFQKKVRLGDSIREIVFENNCDFQNELRIFKRLTNLTIKDSNISYLNLAESIFGKESSEFGKLRLKNCVIERSNFKNATFNGLVDFYQTIFKEKVIFNKTDFLNVLVLSATKFKSNMLFTYTLLNDKVIMRGTEFEKGFDVSLAIIKGDLALFDISLNNKDFIAEEGQLSEEDYEDFVANKGIIPISNKRETFRILKKQFISNEDYIHSLKYKGLELTTYDKILKNNIERNYNKWASKFNRFILWLNRVSNSYGSRFELGVRFIFFISLLFGVPTLFLTRDFWQNLCLGCAFDEKVFIEGVEFYFNFLNPLHKIDYLEDLHPFFGLSYLFDFLGRIFIGYGVYQTVQAFRKYK